jgi:hypothetical protein
VIVPLLSRFYLDPGSAGSEVLLVYVADSQVREAEIVEAITSEFDHNLAPDVLLFVCRATEETRVGNVLQSAAFSRIRDRLGQNRTVQLLTFDGRGEQSTELLTFGSPLPTPITFAQFQRRVMTEIVLKNGGIVSSSARYHFAVPSGRHTDRFLKLTSAPRTIPETSFFAFCLLQHVRPDTKVVHVDSPSLYSLMMAVNDHRRALSLPTLSISSFSSYQGLDSYLFAYRGESQIVISASSSAGLARKLISEQNIDPTDIVHVLYLGPKPESGNMSIVCDLQRESPSNPIGVLEVPSNHAPDTCEICSRGSVAIPLEGDQFEIAGPRHDAVVVVRTDAPNGLSELFRRNVGQRVFTLGLGENRSRYPKLFQIDAASFLGNPNLQQRSRYILSRVVPTNLAAVIILDEWSTEFAQKITDFYAASGNTKRPATIAARDLATRAADDSDGHVVIAGLAIESGRSLQDVSRDLRICFPRAPQTYLIGFAKHTGRPAFDQLQRSLIVNNQPLQHAFVPIEQMLLPKSDGPHPWTLERGLYTDEFLSSATTDRQYWEERKEVLGDLAKPLLDNLFVQNDGTTSLPLRPGFMFWIGVPYDALGHSQSDVFFTIASVLQNLRENLLIDAAGRLRTLRSDRFQQQVLSTENFSRFSDPLIQACLLRAAKPHEMNYATIAEESERVARYVRRIIDRVKGSGGEAAAEFLIALACRRLQLAPKDYATVLNVVSDVPPRIKTLVGVCQRKFLAA